MDIEACHHFDEVIPHAARIDDCTKRTAGSGDEEYASGISHGLIELGSVVPCNIRSENNQRDEHTDKERSEEHTSELQSRFDLVCRLLLEKKNVQHKQAEQHRIRNRSIVRA